MVSKIWLLRSIAHTKALYFYSVKVGTFHRFCTTICSAVIHYSANQCAVESVNSGVRAVRIRMTHLLNYQVRTTLYQWSHLSAPQLTTTVSSNNFLILVELLNEHLDEQRLINLSLVFMTQASRLICKSSFWEYDNHLSSKSRKSFSWCCIY